MACGVVPDGTMARFIESSEMPKSILRNALLDWVGYAASMILTTDAANDLNDGSQEPKV